MPDSPTRPGQGLLPSVDIGHEVPDVFDVVERSTEVGERWVGRFSPRVQGQLMIGGGMLLTAIAWALSPYLQVILASKSKMFIVLTLSPVVLGPALLVYGACAVFLPSVPAAGPGSHFGTMLVEANAEQRWRRRMLAIVIAIVHGMVYLAMN